MEPLKLDWDFYLNCVHTGEANPPGLNAPFITVDPVKYEKNMMDTPQFKMGGVEKRLDKNLLKKIRSAQTYTLDYSYLFFPAYRKMSNELITYEWLSTVDPQKFHRDHLIHQSMTTAIGMWLLDQKICSDMTMLDWAVTAITEKSACDYLKEYFIHLGAGKLCRDFYLSSSRPITKTLWKSLIKDTFFLASLFHDIGYPERFSTALKLKLFPLSPQESRSRREAEWIAATHNNRLLLHPFKGYRIENVAAPGNWQNEIIDLIEKALSRTHGLPGALTFLHLNDMLRKYPDPTAFPIGQFCIEWAAMAIMMHDMAGVYRPENGIVRYPHLRLKFMKDPISALLTLCDQIQDFERPDATFFRHGKSGRASVSLRYRPRCSGVRLALPENKNNPLKITYLFENPVFLMEKRDRYLSAQQDLYFNGVNGFLDFSDIGIPRIQLACELDTAV